MHMVGGDIAGSSISWDADCLVASGAQESFGWLKSWSWKIHALSPFEFLLAPFVAHDVQ